MVFPGLARRSFAVMSRLSIPQESDRAPARRSFLTDNDLLAWSRSSKRQFYSLIQCTPMQWRNASIVTAWPRLSAQLISGA